MKQFSSFGSAKLISSYSDILLVKCNIKFQYKFNFFNVAVSGSYSSLKLLVFPMDYLVIFSYCLFK